MTLEEIAKEVKVAENGDVTVGETRIGLFYLRTGYKETDFEGDLAWEGREKLELNNALKVPSVGMQLAGTKCFQYFTGKSDILEKYCPDEIIRKDINRFSAKRLYYPGGEDEETAKKQVEEVLADKDSFILKAFGEGGNNNKNSEEIEEALKELDNQCILMEKIECPEKKAMLCKNEDFVESNVVSELGVFGVMISDNTEIIENKVIGTVLRTKDASSLEGGVATGYSVIDLPYLN